MGRLIEKMYGSYSDADLNDWERLPLNSRVLTSSAFGAWLLRRDERRDKAIPKADYEQRLKLNMMYILIDLQMEILKELYTVDTCDCFSREQIVWNNALYKIGDIIQEKINALKDGVEFSPRDKFIYALTACGCLLKDGKTWYEHNELIKCFEDLGFIPKEDKEEK